MRWLPSSVHGGGRSGPPRGNQQFADCREYDDGGHSPEPPSSLSLPSPTGEHQIAHPLPFTLYGVHVEADGTVAARPWGEMFSDSTNTIHKQSVPTEFQTLTEKVIVWVSNASLLRAADAVDHYVPGDFGLYRTDNAVLFAVRKLRKLTAYLVLARNPLIVLVYLVANADSQEASYHNSQMVNKFTTALGDCSVMDWCDDMLWYALRHSKEPNPLLTLWDQPVGASPFQYALLYGAKADVFNTAPENTFGHLRPLYDKQKPEPVSRTWAAADRPDWTLLRSAARGWPSARGPPAAPPASVCTVSPRTRPSSVWPPWMPNPGR